MKKNDKGLSGSIKKNDIIIIDIDTVTENGDGIGRAEDGKVVFCFGALPDETVSCRIIKVTSGYYIGKLQEIIKHSERSGRIEPSCDVFYKCGGCVFCHADYNAQLEFKVSHVHDCINRIGGISDYEKEPVMPSPLTEHYRNKSIYQFAENDFKGDSEAENGKLLCGFYRRNSHDVVSCDNCIIEDSVAKKIREAFCKTAEAFNYTAYNEDTDRGLLKRLMVRTSLKNRNAVAVAVINGEKLPREKEFTESLVKACGHKLCGFYVNVHKIRNNNVMTDDFRLIYGDAVLKDNIGPAEFNISPQSFYQVNPLQTERLYEKAFEYAALKDGEALVDLFCGIGTIGIYFAKRATEQGIKLRSLLGIEYTERAVKDAAVNAELNGVSDISNFLAGDAEKVLGKIAEEVEKSKPDVMVVDPPRKGLTENLIKSVAFCKPSRVVYVSCNPATLARDLKVFEAEGYKTEKVCAVDMFPGSGHCETVVLLSRQIIVHKMKK